MKVSDGRLPVGTSDAVSFSCTCGASSSGGGTILLFYRYFAAPPSLQSLPIDGPSGLAAFHTELTSKLQLGGKIRVGSEGFNITVGGTSDNIEQYIKECMEHWSFSGLNLPTKHEQDLFFKPTPGGCACAFGGAPASVRVTAEITPMGVTNYIPEIWDVVKNLSPAEFHERCWRDEKKIMVDVRNHYESRIGYFVDPVTGEKAIRPDIRRFSQWPQYVKAHKEDFENGTGGGSRQIMTYCTGGIRCEKGVRWMADHLNVQEGDTICTLQGGIAAYLTWMDEEIKNGKKRPEDSLFHGKNYVFDARGSTGLLEDPSSKPVSTCHVCSTPSDRMSKCRSSGCHLILVVCGSCEESDDPRCCKDCLQLDMEDVDEKLPKVPRRICECEKQREAQLWGGNSSRQPKVQGWKKEKRLAARKYDIRVQTVD